MSEIGVIGSMYEDRRTKKKGKLLERDNKFKTLLMESEDGKSFNITFGGFKSNWRKIDEPEQTVEEAMEEKIPEEQITVKKPKEKKPVKKSEKKSVKKKVVDAEINEGLENATTSLAEFVQSFENPRLRLRTVLEKKSNALILDDRKQFELVYSRMKNRFSVCMTEKIAQLLSKKPYASKIVFHEKWITTKYAFFMSADYLPDFLDDMKEIIATFMCEEE